MKRKLLVMLSLVIIFSLFVTACSMSSQDSSYEESRDMAPLSNAEDNIEAEYDMPSEESDMAGSSIQPEKVITTINLGFETEGFDEFTSDLEESIAENDGYIEYSDIWYGGSSRAYRRGEYVIRIPQENTHKFKDNINEIGNLLNESTNRQDVTSQYKDTESRLRVLETREERILELLESADVMTDIIELNRELSNIIYEKEQLTSQLMALDDKIDYSTINLNVEEVERYSNTEDMDTGLGTRIKHAFEDSLHFFYTSMESLVVLFVYLIPFLLILLILAFIGKKVYERYIK